MGIKNKAIYLRKSRESGEEADTLATHRSVLVRMCEQNGWTYDLYEEVTSGESEKPELNRLLDNVEKYDAIVVMDVDRLSRDKVESFQIQALLLSHNVKVITPNGTYNLEDESSDMMFSIKSIFASAELKKTKARMKAGKMNRFRNGEYSLGRPPLGYKIVDKRLVIDEDTAPMVRRMFEMSASGMGHNTIARELGLSTSYVGYLLKNRTFIGQANAQFGEETVTQVVPPIIDIDLFVRVQEEVKRRDKSSMYTRGVARSFLTGLVKCVQCKNQMTVNRKKHKNGDSGYLTLRCNNPNCSTSAVSLAIAEKMVEWELDDGLDAIFDVLEERKDKEEVNTLADEIHAVQTELDELKSKLERVKDMYQDGDLTKEQYKARKADIDEQIQHLTLKLQSLELKNEYSETKELEELATELSSFDSMDIVERNALLRKLIDVIWYERNLPKRRHGGNNVGEDEPPTLKIVWRQF